MPFLLLFLLSLASLQGSLNERSANTWESPWPKPPAWLDPLAGAALTWTGIAFFWLLAAWHTQRCCQTLAADIANRGQLVRHVNSWRRLHLSALLVFYVAALYFLGWGWTLDVSWPGQVLPGFEVMLLAPVVAGLVVCWARFYDVDRLAHDIGTYPVDRPFPSRWAYVSLQARHNLILIVPPLFLIFLQQCLFLLFPGLDNLHGPLVPFLGIALLALAFLSIPFLLRWFLGLRPLPPGPIRDRLESAARRLRFRFSDVLVWNTRGTVANAMVTGVLPWMRYIVVTDRLLEALTEDEIEAVFGHEVGHVKHHHMFFYILFIVGSLVALGGIGYLAVVQFRQAGVRVLLQENLPLLGGILDHVHLYALLPLLVLFAGYMFVVFGYLSRRCERQADIFGCRAVSTQSFVSALEKVAALNGIPREQPGWFSSWQHGSIAQRVEFLLKMNDDPHLEPRFQSRLRWLKWGVTVGLASLAGGVLLTMHQVLRPEEMWRFLQGL